VTASSVRSKTKFRKSRAGTSRSLQQDTAVVKGLLFFTQERPAWPIAVATPTTRPR
jgi:hypothetical protein